MNFDQRHNPSYEISWPACGEKFLQTPFKVITENSTHCPACHVRINADIYYSRAKTEDLMEKIGHSRNFISVNDKF